MQQHLKLKGKRFLITFSYLQASFVNWILITKCLSKFILETLVLKRLSQLKLNILLDIIGLIFFAYLVKMCFMYYIIIFFPISLKFLQLYKYINIYVDIFHIKLYKIHLNIAFIYSISWAVIFQATWSFASMEND